MAEAVIWVLFFFSGEYARTTINESRYEFVLQTDCNKARDAYNQRAPKREIQTRAECIPFPNSARRK